MVKENTIYIEIIKSSQHLHKARELKQILSQEEICKADKFAFEYLRNQYIVAHGILRKVIAEILKCEASQIMFEKNNFGKPFIKNSDLQFNISHSKNYILMGFSKNIELGIDVEFIQRNNNQIESILHSFFSYKEKLFFDRLDDNIKTDMFYKLWTRKESFIKAIGRGLQFPLDSFSVPFNDNIPCMVDIHEKDYLDTRVWFVNNIIRFHDDYQSSVVTKGIPNSIVFNEFVNCYSVF